jgi:hypothetical protein
MPVEWKVDKDNLVVFRVSGQLSVDEFRNAQADMESSIRQLGWVKALILLDGFDGWQGGAGWEDASFEERNDPFIRKIAFVGDAQWRDQVYTFAMKGLRPVPMEYFSSDEESRARDWLAEE